MGTDKSGMVARRITEADREVLSRWFLDAEIQETIEDEERSPEEIAAKLKKLCNADPVRDCECGVLIEMDGVPIGFSHFMWINWFSRNAELDTFLDPNMKGGPFMATLAMRKVAEVAFETYNLNKVYGFIYASNQRALKMLTTFMTIEATLKRYMLHDGKAEDVYVGGLLASTYFAMRRKKR